MFTRHPPPGNDLQMNTRHKSQLLSAFAQLFLLFLLFFLLVLSIPLSICFARTSEQGIVPFSGTGLSPLIPSDNLTTPGVVVAADVSYERYRHPGSRLGGTVNHPSKIGEATFCRLIVCDYAPVLDPLIMVCTTNMDGIQEAILSSVNGFMLRHDFLVIWMRSVSSDALAWHLLRIGQSCTKVLHIVHTGLAPGRARYLLGGGGYSNCNPRFSIDEIVAHLEMKMPSDFSPYYDAKYLTTLCLDHAPGGTIVDGTVLGSCQAFATAQITRIV